jgi:hypothetical protein
MLKERKKRESNLLIYKNKYWKICKPFFLLSDYASFISGTIHVCWVWWHAHSFGLPSASIWNYLLSLYYTVYLSSHFQTVKNALCSVIVSHLQFLQTTFPEFVDVQFNLFSFCCHCWIRWDSFELWNMMLYQFVEYCSCRLSLSICFLPSSTATNIFAEFAELRVLQLS